MSENKSTPPSATTKLDFDAERHVDCMAGLLGMPIDSEHRDAVCFNLRRIHAMATLVMEAELPEATEPASVYRP